MTSPDPLPAGGETPPLSRLEASVALHEIDRATERIRDKLYVQVIEHILNALLFPAMVLLAHYDDLNRWVILLGGIALGLSLLLIDLGCRVVDRDAERRAKRPRLVAMALAVGALYVVNFHGDGLPTLAVVMIAVIPGLPELWVAWRVRRR